MSMIVPVILAGGSGTRLWPLSRQLHPKQFLPLVNHKTMLQDTVQRFADSSTVLRPIILSNHEHRFMVAEQLRSIQCTPSAIILEPFGRNTAPAIATAALQSASDGEDPVLLVLPADHYIEQLGPLQEAVHIGRHLAEAGFLVTFGIVPHAPETGYGYIEKETSPPLAAILPPEYRDAAAPIRKFVEKPDQETAQAYCMSGRYLWNSGMFMFKATAYLRELQKFNPAMLEACREATTKAQRDLDFIRLDQEAFASCSSDSVDYAVMEKTSKGVVIPLECGWSDVGSWDALWEVKEKDENGNASIGDVLTKNVKRSYLHSTSRLLAVVGVEDHVIVETPDAVMVSPKDKVQDVKLLVDKLKAAKRQEATSHRKVYRPWGSYDTINIDERFQVKRITVKPGAKLSLQKHYHRAEHWVVVKGTAIITRGDEQIILKEDESSYIPLGFLHRLENPGRIPLELIEVQTGSYLGEDDIARMDDIYGRTN